MSALSMPPVPKDEAARHAALLACGVLDTAPDPAFDELTQLAAEICEAPVALLSFVDTDRQWFKSRVNFQVTETPRRISFCAHAIVQNVPMVIPDAIQDPRFFDNPMVAGQPGFRFYAGAPLHVDGGSAIGTLCVLDYVPRVISAGQLEALAALGRQISRELQRRQDAGRRWSSAPPGALPVGPGDVIDQRYTLDRSLGRGASGAVFEAHTGDGRKVAVKILLPELAGNLELVERFVREARILSGLDSPHIARLLDVGNLDLARGKAPFIVLEYLKGISLDHLLHQHGKQPWRQACRWVADGCLGIAEAHRAGIVHRDLKPSNLFLTQEADGRQVLKVLDFGIAKLGGSDRLTRSDSVIGTPAYMSPEQMHAAEHVDARSDTWSMGAVLYQLLSGQEPFPGGSLMQICAAILMRAPPSVCESSPDVPPAVASIVTKCLQKLPEARFQTITELATALNQCLTQA